MKAAATTAGSLQKTNVSQKRKNTAKNVYGWVKGLVLPFVIIAVWQIAGSMEIVSATVLPTPLVILLTFKDLIVSGELFVHLKISVYRAAAGFLSGAGLGLLIGLLVGFSRKTEHYIDPSLQMLRTVPHLAVTPLFILWFGFDETSKILLIALGAFFPVYINTFLGIRGVDSKLFDVAKVLEFPWYRQMTKLILPAALPSILLGIRLSLGIAWLGLVVAELMGSSEGIGYMIMDARQFSQTNKVFVGIIIFAVVGKLTDSFVRFLERKLLKWRNSYQG
ncbi:binding--dependent transport system inner membrane component family protein [Bacillus atrophaeus subsp. globigii]|uniref:Aliphatic sulfonate ABC transporter (Permease) n=2 Tax=Bacillus atrophaeus TaxID=1452 RepID=A0ABM5LUG7_BACA1|nr:aliphatic sulfonate ABC transporter (permease) [Bacillus atrophaeus 1942]AIK45585.1 binding--dependent transport system inner membrane component family protein [Bacillus atrophaeus subsp. globigii]AKL83616.1 SsuC [Bacillus atrophaeus UCMB-5137]AMR64771.1 ABC transporter permease [Bacillus subtilis subsp. globigii]EIM09985.1 aliphatic sulfonate ABC transporter permease [Bacillus atrophaeus C89]KFK84588.1 binding--dependent transport system inner membrane component family protein [Bacillus at